jgi:hypothetical protein
MPRTGRPPTFRNPKRFLFTLEQDEYDRVRLRAVMAGEPVTVWLRDELVAHLDDIDALEAQARGSGAPEISDFIYTKRRAKRRKDRP